MLTVVMMTMFIGLVIALGVTSPVTREARIARELLRSKIGFVVAEASEEDVAYRVREGMIHDNIEVLEIDGVFATTTVTDNIETGIKELSTRGENKIYVRKKKMRLILGDNVTFNYGVQAGQGGFLMKNSSSVRGNVYSNGAVTATQRNLVRGNVVSANSTGLVDGVHATGTTRANTIRDSTVEGDAYYQTLEDTVVFGTLYPGSPDPLEQPFPISDEQIDSWQQAAEAGGVISAPCPFVIGANTTIGPIKFACGLKIKGAKTELTLAGMVWVVGDIDIKNAAKIKLDPSLGLKSVALIANDPADQINSSIITLRNAMAFVGNGPGTFIMVISRNRDAEEGGDTFGIDFQQTATGDALLYSNHSGILITNNSLLEQVTGWRIELRNAAELIYEKGLESSFFDTGPGGSWDIVDWREVE